MIFNLTDYNPDDTIKHIKSVNRGGYHRCSICDSVSNESIETNLGDFKPGISFTNDPKNSMHFICTPCSESIEDVRQDYEWKDYYEDYFLEIDSDTLDDVLDINQKGDLR